MSSPDSAALCALCTDAPASLNLHDGHSCCESCAISQAQACVETGGTSRLPIPCPLCPGGASAQRLPILLPMWSVLPRPLFTRVARAEVHVAGLRLVECPHCSETLVVDDACGGGCDVCTNCARSFCSACGSSAPHSAPAACPAARAARTPADEELLALGSREGWGRCVCGMVVVRDGGCYHMKHEGCTLLAERFRGAPSHVRHTVAAAALHFCFLCSAELCADGRREARAPHALHFPAGVYEPCTQGLARARPPAPTPPRERELTHLEILRREMNIALQRNRRVLNHREQLLVERGRLRADAALQRQRQLDLDQAQRAAFAVAHPRPLPRDAFGRLTIHPRTPPASPLARPVSATVWAAAGLDMDAAALVRGGLVREEEHAMQAALWAAAGPGGAGAVAPGAAQMIPRRVPQWGEPGAAAAAWAQLEREAQGQRAVRRAN